MTFEVHKESYKGLTIRIEAEEYPESPCDMWEELGTMVCCHRNYNLGHEQADVDTINELAQNKGNIVLPLYLMDHSGLSMNTGGFGCPWDSGQVGIIYVSKEQVRKEWGVKRISPKLHKQIVACLEGQVETYDDYLTGNVWGYTVEDEDGEVLDSCAGFYGDWERASGCLDEARFTADSVVRDRIYTHVATLKQWIKSKVPFQYRNPCPVVGGSN